MLLTELLFQRVKDLGAQDKLALKPGYVAIVSRAASLRALIVGSLFPSGDDARSLVDGAGLTRAAGPTRPGGDGPTRIGVGLLGRDGTPYRLLREIGAARQLHKFDPALKKFSSLTQDDLEIASFLRVESELPQPEIYARFFALGSNELPSLAALPAAPSANLDKADLSRAQALKAELVQTKAFEEAQDKLFKVQQRLHELSETGGKLEAAERDFNELDVQLSRSLFSPAQIRELTSRATRAPTDLRKHTDQLAELQTAQRTLEEEMPPEPEELSRDPLLWGGLLGGVAIDLIAAFTEHPLLALLGLLPFGAALVAALRWIDAREQLAQAKAQAKRLVEREAAVKKAFAEEQAPLRAALKAAGTAQPNELLDLFKHRDEVGALRDAAKARLEALRATPGIAEVAKERPQLMEEKLVLEMTVAAQGFARPVVEIERDLRRSMGIITDPNVGKRSASGVDPAQAPRLLLETAAAIVNVSPAELWQSLGARLTTYLAALTDKRVVAARLDSNGLLSAFAADGRGGPYASLPGQLRDLTYAALRLSLLERVAPHKRLPIFVDDTFAALEVQKRALVHKMLKGISAETQVIHRCVEPPPPNLADHLVQL